MSDSKHFPGFNDAEDYCKAVLQNIAACAKTANGFDVELFDYYNSFKGFREAMGKQREDILSLITKLIPGQRAGEDNFSQLDEDEQMDALKDVNSSILENVSYLLDENVGEKKPDIELVVSTRPRLPINTSWNRSKTKKNSDNNDNVSLLTAKNISRPQMAFKDKVDNKNTPFVPIIKEKPNSLKPLAILIEKNEDGSEEFCHPYEFELDKFEPLPMQLESTEPIVPKSIQDTPLIYVETVDALNSMCADLKTKTEFSVDIEHHSYRTFQGFSCLLQISSREKDYIIDCIALRSDMWLLNEVFTDPKIVKVFHGADMDIVWLQRDFGVYVVNMFDTGQAARVLNFAHLSLSYLMRHYCNIELNKQFQLADWRIRPLPKELLKYAREDTHYLLYIFDCMKNQLLKEGNNLKNLLCSVFQRSKEICLKKYQKPLFTEDKYLDLHIKSRKSFNCRQMYCLKELYAWRDGNARLEDESYGYVLPNHMMLQISEVLPREHQGILACCNPVPPLVHQHLNDLYSIVTKANNHSLSQLLEPKNKSQTTESNTISQFDLNSMLHGVHDIHAYDDTRMHLHHNSAEKAKSKISTVGIVHNKMAALSFNVGSVTIEEGECVSEKAASKVEETMNKQNKSFFERYQLTLKYREENRLQEEETAEKQTSGASSSNCLSEHQPATVSQGAGAQESSEVFISFKENEKIQNDKANLKSKKRSHQKEFTNSTPGESLPPAKKQKTPDTSCSENNKFQPFDYSKHKYNANKKDKNQNRPLFKPQEGFQHPKGRGKNRKQRQGKQMSFNSHANRGQSSNKRWPTM